MLCPICNVDLLMSERQGVEIDYCPKCRGVWLDRGEIDKLIERSVAEQQPQRPAQPQPQPQPVQTHQPHQPRYGYDDDHRHGYHKHRKKSFLSEILDFD